MAETGVWAPCESPAHAASTASSTVDADLMVTDGDRVVVDKELAAALWTRTSSFITLLRIAGTQYHGVGAWRLLVTTLHFFRWGGGGPWRELF